MKSTIVDRNMGSGLLGRLLNISTEGHAVSPLAIPPTCDLLVTTFARFQYASSEAKFVGGYYRSVDDEAGRLVSAV